MRRFRQTICAGICILMLWSLCDSRRAHAETDAERRRSALQGSRALAVSFKQRWVAIGEFGERVRIVRLSDMTTERQLRGPEHTGHQFAAFARDQQSVYTLAWNGRIPPHPELIPAALAARDQWLREDASGPALEATMGPMMNVLPTPNYVSRWDLQSGEEVGRIAADNAVVIALVGSPDYEEVALLLARHLSNEKIEVRLRRLNADSGDLAAPDVVLHRSWRHQVTSLQSWMNLYASAANQAPSLFYSQDGARLIVAFPEFLITFDRATSRVSSPRRLPWANPNRSALAGAGLALMGDELWHATLGLKPDGTPRLDLNGINVRSGQVLSRTWLPFPQIQLRPHEPVPLYVGTDGSQLFVSYRQDGNWSCHPRVQPLRRRSRLLEQMRVDLVLDDGRALSGAALTELDGTVLDVSPDPNAFMVHPAQNAFDEDVLHGAPIHVFQNGSRVVYESDTEFLIWNCRNQAVEARTPRPGNAKVVKFRDVGRLRWGTQVTQSGDSLIFAVPTDRSANLKDFRTALGDVAEQIPAHLGSAPDETQKEVWRHLLGRRWQLYRWHPESGSGLELLTYVDSPGIDLVDSGGTVVCVYFEPGFRRLNRLLVRPDGSTARATLLNQDRPQASLSSYSIVMDGAAQGTTVVKSRSLLLCPWVRARTDREGLVRIVAHAPELSSNALALTYDLKSEGVRIRKIYEPTREIDPSILDFWSRTRCIAVNERTQRAVVIAAQYDAGGDGLPASQLSQSVVRMAIRVVDLTSGRLIHQYPIPSRVFNAQQMQGLRPETLRDLILPLAAELSPSGQLLNLTLPGKTYLNTVFDLGTGQLLCGFHTDTPAKFLDDESHLVTGDQVWLARTGEPVQRLPAFVPADVDAESSGVELAFHEGPRDEGWMWFFGIGCNQDQDRVFPRLYFSEKDVASTRNRLRQLFEPRFANFQSNMFVDKRVTNLVAVENAFESLATAAQPEDVVVLMFSGHGIRGQRGLYLLTYESKRTDLQWTAINWETIAGTVARLRAEKIIVLLDTCHAGDFAESNLAIQAELRKRLQGKQGVVVIASSQGNEESKEKLDLKHGAFTRSVLDALESEGGADANGDNAITVREFFDFVAERTALLTDREQNPKIVLQRVPDDEALFAPRRRIAPDQLVETRRIIVPPPLPNEDAAIQNPSSNDLGMEFVAIQPGEFEMGSQDSPAKVAAEFPLAPEQAFVHEHPRRRVRISRGFYLMTHEVTIGQFDQFVAETRHLTDREQLPDAQPRGTDEPIPTWNRGPHANNRRHPVTYVSHRDAQAFCSWFGERQGVLARLPTQAEWEYACRAGATTRFAHGQDPSSLVPFANVPNRGQGTFLTLQQGRQWVTTFVPEDIGRVEFDRQLRPRFSPIPPGRAPAGLVIANGSPQILTLGIGGKRFQLPSKSEVRRERNLQPRMVIGTIEFLAGKQKEWKPIERFAGTWCLAKFSAGDWTFVGGDYLSIEAIKQTAAVIRNGSRQVLHVRSHAAAPPISIPPGEEATVKLRRTDHACYVDQSDGFNGLAPVSQFNANAWGLNDMHGNVNEWCDDPFYDYRDLVTDSEGVVVDPVGSADPRAVFRGGGYRQRFAFHRCASRIAVPPNAADADIGFRVLVEAGAAGG